MIFISLLSIRMQKCDLQIYLISQNIVCFLGKIRTEGHSHPPDQ